MSDPKYQYANQSNFTGGIATEPELRRVTKAGEVTVAEAADVWAPNGVLKRRPGVYRNLNGNINGATSSYGIPFMQAGVVFQAADGTIITPSGSLVIASGGGAGVLYIPYASGDQVVRFNTFSSGTVNFLEQYAVWCPPGFTDPYLSGQRIDFTYDVANNGVKIGDPVTSGTAYAVFSVSSSSGNLVLFSGVTAVTGLAKSSEYSLLGGAFSPLPSGVKYLSLFQLSTDLAYQIRLQASNSVSAYNSINPVASADVALFNPLSPPPSWATVVDANRTYVAFSNQIYEYRPELATPFRLAQVNSEPLIVGPGGTYDSSIFAQYPRFPNAGQIVYFNGLLFMTDIKGNPNVVQWGGPAIDGAVDVLPVLSYAILTDSRDNSPNVGFGVYNSNLYVFKQNSIWAMIPAGQSEVDGSYLFTTRLVTSGAGCSAPGSIVSTPNGIIFYNQGGFYIFNGQKTEKLTSPVKKLFDAIVPGNAYQMQATHWPQRHSYVVTCKMSHPWPSDVFEDLPQIFDGTLEYDYQNNAWWLWLSVSGKSLFMNNSGNLITQDLPFEFRILDPEKNYDSDVLAKSTATPYFKTQRFGYGESLQKQYRELRLTGEIDNLNVETSIEINDQILAATDYDITFIPVDYDIVPLGTLIPDGDPYSPPWGRFEQPIEVQNDGQWAQVRVNGGYGPFTVYNLNLGYYVEGRNG